MRIIDCITDRRAIILGSLVFIALFMLACAGFKRPLEINEAPVHARAVSEEENGIRASAAVVGDQEAIQIFGIDLARKKIQAVWVAIENNSGPPVLLLPTAIDREYFAPLEVAYAYHRILATAANAALNEHLENLNFPIRTLIRSGSQASGYIFTNWQKGMKVIDIDLLGDDFSQNFTLFAANPEETSGQAIVQRIETMFSADELQDLQSEAALRQALEQLPCCVSDESGTRKGEPLNVVVIGALDDWSTAFIRRGYTYHVLNSRFAFGRIQDISGKKLNRGYTRAQAQTIRLWQTSIRYRGMPVWIGQIGVRRGGRFAEKQPIEVTLPLDPYVDEARLDLAMDLAYSQALVKIGWVKGSGQPPSNRVEDAPGSVFYTTDGLRAVLVFGDRPASLEEIEFFDWERLDDYR